MYIEHYQNLEALVEASIKTSQSNSGTSSPTSAHYLSSLLFTKICTSAKSIIEFTPHPSNLGKSSHWDFSSTASLTRSFIECYLVFRYLCIEKCPDNEWSARWKLMNLHDHFSREKLFKSAGENIEQNEEAAKIRKDVVNELTSNTWFQKLTDKQQKHFLKGNTAFFSSQDEIIGSCAELSPEFRFVYRYLSNNMHSFPMGFYRMAENNRGAGVETEFEVKWSGVCLDWVSKYLARAKREYEELFNDCSDMQQTVKK